MMYKILEFREIYRSVYSKYSIYIDAAWKALVVLLGLITVNSYVGAMSILENPLIVILVSLICAALPKNLGAMIVLMTIVAHISEVALEPAVLILVMYILMYLLYFRFSSKDSAVLILVPVLFMLKVPYIVPIVLGLVATPVSAISVTFGTMIYFVLAYAEANYDVMLKLGNKGGFDIMSMFVKGVLLNKSFYFCIVVFAFVIVVVYVIKNLSIDYSWIIAVCVGGVAQIIIFLVGNIVIDLSLVTSVGFTILGGLLSLLAAWLLQFFMHSVDYTRTTNVQFEDDEYYYYVKAVPKIKVASGDVKVKRVNAAPSVKKK